MSPHGLRQAGEKRSEPLLISPDYILSSIMKDSACRGQGNNGPPSALLGQIDGIDDPSENFLDAQASVHYIDRKGWR